MRRWIGMVMAVVLALMVWAPMVGAESLQGTNLTGYFQGATSAWSHIFGVATTGQKVHIYRTDAWCDPASNGGFSILDTITGQGINTAWEAPVGSNTVPFTYGPNNPGMTSVSGGALRVYVTCAPGSVPRLNAIVDQY